MATSPVAYPVRITTLYLGQVQSMSSIGTMMFVPGIPAVVMLFMKLSCTNQSQTTPSPGAAITPASFTRAIVGPYVAAARRMAPTLDCSTRTAAVATLIITTAAFVLCCCPPPRVPLYLNISLHLPIATPGDKVEIRPIIERIKND